MMYTEIDQRYKKEKEKILIGRGIFFETIDIAQINVQTAFIVFASKDIRKAELIVKYAERLCKANGLKVLYVFGLKKYRVIFENSEKIEFISIDIFDHLLALAKYLSVYHNFSRIYLITDNDEFGELSKPLIREGEMSLEEYIRDVALRIPEEKFL